MVFFTFNIKTWNAVNNKKQIYHKDIVCCIKYTWFILNDLMYIVYSRSYLLY